MLTLAPFSSSLQNPHALRATFFGKASEREEQERRAFIPGRYVINFQGVIPKHDPTEISEEDLQSLLKMERSELEKQIMWADNAEYQPGRKGYSSIICLHGQRKSFSKEELARVILLNEELMRRHWRNDNFVTENALIHIRKNRNNMLEVRRASIAPWKCIMRMTTLCNHFLKPRDFSLN